MASEIPTSIAPPSTHEPDVDFRLPYVRQDAMAPRGYWQLTALAVLLVAAVIVGVYYWRLDSLLFGGGSRPAARAQQYVDQGVLYAATNNYDMAVRQFTRAIDVDPNHTAAYVNRGVAYMKQGRPIDAFNDLKRAERLSPRDKMVLYNLSAFYASQGHVDRALDALDRALSNGFDDHNAIRDDPDLAPIRKDAGFRSLLEKHNMTPR